MVKDREIKTDERLESASKSQRDGQSEEAKTETETWRQRQEDERMEGRWGGGDGQRDGRKHKVKTTQMETDGAARLI